MLIELKGLRKEFPRGGRLHRRCSLEVLERTLRREPPNLERVDELESYVVDGDGNRIRRVCGNRLLRGLPSTVPQGVANPHGVTDPYEQYRCTSVAGYGVPHLEGFGPCRRHLPPFLQSREGMQEYVMEKLAKRGYSEGKDAVTGVGSLQKHITDVEMRMKVSELLDSTRLLFEMEALRAMAKEAMDTDGYDQERADHIASLMVKQTDMHLKMAKTDNELIKNQALAAILRVVLNGVVAIVEEQLGPEEAANVLVQFRERLVIPITEQGFTEVLIRQQASGVGDAITVAANDFSVGDVTGE